MTTREETGPQAPRPPGAAGVPALLPGDHPKARTVLISLLGLTGEARREAIASASIKASLDEESPVFLTDDLDLSAFSEEGHFYEYLPPVAEQLRHAQGKRWDLYIAQKVRIILAKWRPSRVIELGQPIEDFVARMKAAHGLS